MRYEYRIKIEAETSDDVVQLLRYLITVIDDNGGIKDHRAINKETRANIIAEKREHLPGFLDAVNDVIENG